MTEYKIKKIKFFVLSSVFCDNSNWEWLYAVQKHKKRSSGDI